MLQHYLTLLTDLNECAETERGGCTQGCQNNIGAFTCFCGNGYTLNNDGKTCDGKPFFALDLSHVKTTHKI